MPSDATRLQVPFLYIVIFVSWSGAWFAMKMQTEDVSPIVSVAVRFLLAAPIAFLIAGLKRERLIITWPEHLRIAAIGATMFSANFIFAYYAAAHLTSGLISAIFSLTASFNLLFSWIFFRKSPTAMDISGAIAGSLGLLLLMWTEVESTGAGDRPLLGIALAIGMTISFSLGNMASFGLQQRGSRMLPAMAWAMAWGGFFATVVALLTGQRWLIPINPSYLGSLAFLICAGTVTAFLAYSALIARAGAFKAASLNLVVPTGAFLISTILEDYSWTLSSISGLALVLSGNYLILTKSRCSS